MLRIKHKILQTPIPYVISVLVVLVVFCVVPVGVYLAFFASTQQLPMYESSSVEKICRVLRIDQEDDFCINHSQQNANTLEALLQRYFPVDDSFQDDIMSLVEVRFTNPSYDLLDELGTSAVGFCPAPQERGETYSCVILFSPPVGPLTIFFDGSTKKAMRYIAWRPSGS